VAKDDKKEYKDFLVLLSFMGSGPAVLNKLDQMIQKMEDPRLREQVENLTKFFRSLPECVHLKKFRILNFASVNRNSTGQDKSASDLIFALEKYCQDQVQSQIPQWQIIAKAAGWTAPIG